MISQDAASVDLNIDAGTLYIDSTNNRVGVANTSPATALDVTGTITADNIKLGDNQRVQIGDGQDFQFYHDGSNSYILATGGSGSLITRADVFGVQDSSNINMIEAASTTGVVTLYYNTGSTSAARLATSSTGVSVTGNLTTTGYIAGPSTFTIDPAAVGDNTGTVVIAGNLQVDGTTTTINSTTLTVDDKLITLASGSANAGAANGAGIEVEISGATNPSLTYDGTNDEWDFNKDVNVTGTLTASGGSSNNDSTANILTLNASEHARLVVDTSSTGGHRATLALKSNNNETQLTTTGSASFLNVASGSLTVDVPGDIILDADTDGRVFFFDGGTEYGNVGKSSDSLILKSAISDGDILVQGNDGGSTITALLLDMSQAGRATFNEGIVLKSSSAGDFGVNINTASGDSMKLQVVDTGTSGAAHGSIAVSDGNFTLDVAGDIILDTGGDDIKFKVGGTDFGSIYYSNSNLYLKSAVSNGDVIFQGNDDGSTVTALTLDMSNAGYATFNNGIILKNELWINNADGSASVGYLYNDSNDFVIRSYTSNQDIIFKGNDGGSVIEAMRIDMSAGGNVGIGTDSPTTAKVVVNGDANTYTLRLDGSTTTGQSYGARVRAGTNSSDAAFRVENTSASSLFFVRGDGNVGIGTDSPQMGLHVGSGSQAIAALAGIGIANGSSAYSFFQASDGTKQYIAGVDHNITYTKSGTLSNHDHAIVTNNNNRIYIKNTGNVGIGTDSPSKQLSIFNSSPSWNQYATLRLATETEGTYYGDISFHRGTSNDTDRGFVFNLGGTERMRILHSSGEIRIDSGSSQRPIIKPTRWGYSAGYRVALLGSASTSYSTTGTGSITLSMGYDPSGNTNGAFSGDGREILFRRGAQFVTPNSADDSFYLYNLVLKDGSVGIGTNSPGYMLTVNGDFQSLGVYSYGDTALGANTDGRTDQTIFGGFGVLAGNGVRYGNYGNLAFRSSANYTGSSRAYLITNGYESNKFAIIQGTDATTIPNISGTGGGATNGSPIFTINSASNVGIGTGSPNGQLEVNVTEGDPGLLVSSSSENTIINKTQTIQCMNQLSASNTWQDVAFIGHSCTINVIGKSIQSGDPSYGGASTTATISVQYGVGAVTHHHQQYYALNGGDVTSNIEYRYLNSGASSGSYRLQVKMSYSGGTQRIYTSITGVSVSYMYEDD